MPTKKPKTAAEPTTWEACAKALTPRGDQVTILGREWEPGEWQPITDDEKAILDANYNVLTVREAKTDHLPPAKDQGLAPPTSERRQTSRTGTH